LLRLSDQLPSQGISFMPSRRDIHPPSLAMKEALAARPDVLLSLTDALMKPRLRAVPGFGAVDTYKPHGGKREYTGLREVEIGEQETSCAAS
jgi:hypothetical protein